MLLKVPYVRRFPIPRCRPRRCLPTDLRCLPTSSFAVHVAFCFISPTDWPESTRKVPHSRCDPPKYPGLPARRQARRPPPTCPKLALFAGSGLTYDCAVRRIAARWSGYALGFGFERVSVDDAHHRGFTAAAHPCRVLHAWRPRFVPLSARIARRRASRTRT